MDLNQFLNLQEIIRSLQSWPPEAVWCILAVFSFSSIIVLLRLFGPSGLYAYIGIAMVVANIQVLTAVPFNVSTNPLPLGTVVFSTIYLCTDILNEYYGAKAAQKAVWIGFMTYLVFVLFMIITMCFRPLTVEEAGEPYAWAVISNESIETLFLPSISLLVSGMAAFVVSQYSDIFVYRIIKMLFKGKYLWLRNNVSTALSALIDNTIFSILAWRVFASEPKEWEVVIFSYILGTYLIRLVIAFLDTPIIYLARHATGKDSDNMVQIEQKA